MLVTLYTSRVVLDVLGAIDYGVYNVVGGIVVLFSFIYGALTLATQRFLNYSMGKGDYAEVHKVFCVSFNVYFLLILLIAILCETIGLWFLNNKLDIPADRMDAAFWVFQFSVASCVFTILRIPYNSSIIAYERMSFYAYVSIIEVALKLAVVYLLFLSQQDKLVFYAFLMFLVHVIMLAVYYCYCRKAFTTTRYKFIWDGPLFKKLLSFSGWSLFGSFANVAASQGLSFILNIFNGVLVNAALGVANQVNSAVNQFVTSFQTAFTPQLIKSYAANEKDFFFSLIFRSSKFSYYLILILGLPLILYCKDILGFWLVDVPGNAVEFTVLLVIFCFIDALSGPLWYSVQATGNIKRYQIIMSVCILSNIPLSYIALKLGCAPIVCLYIRVGINLLIHFIRVFYLKGLMEFPSIQYLKDVMLPVCLVTVVSFGLSQLLHRGGLGIGMLFAHLAITGTIVLLTAYFLGLNRQEKQTVVSYVGKILKHA